VPNRSCAQALVFALMSLYRNRVRHSFKGVAMAQVALFTFGLLHKPVAYVKNREYLDEGAAGNAPAPHLQPAHRIYSPDRSGVSLEMALPALPQVSV
jgi:hypothetical protein